MYQYHSDEHFAAVKHEDIAKLLRSMGALGNLRGFDYIVFIIYRIMQQPNETYWVTKQAYPEAARFFQVTPGSVERSVRTVIRTIWDKYDHSDLDRVAGRRVEDIPTNGEFFDILAAYLSYGSFPRNEKYLHY